MTSFDSGLFSISSSPPPYSLRVVNKWAERIKYSYLCANTSLPKPLTTVCRLIVQVQLTATKHCHKSLPSVTNTNSELVSLWACEPQWIICQSERWVIVIVKVVAVNLVAVALPVWGAHKCSHVGVCVLMRLFVQLLTIWFPPSIFWSSDTSAIMGGDNWKIK